MVAGQNHKNESRFTFGLLREMVLKPEWRPLSQSGLTLNKDNYPFQIQINSSLIIISPCFHIANKINIKFAQYYLCAIANLCCYC